MRQLRDIGGTSELFIGVIVELVDDPKAVLEAAADIQEHLHRGTRRPTPWMQRMRTGQKRVTLSAESGVPLFDGRPCCAAHLARYEGRTDLEMPCDVTCPDCARVFRVRLDIVRRRA